MEDADEEDSIREQISRGWDGPGRLARPSSGLSKKVVPWLRECCRQTQAEVVSKSTNKIHEILGPPFSLALYVRGPSMESVTNIQ